MGHRALLAVEGTRGEYDLYYAHEGAYDWCLATAVETETLREDTRASLSETLDVDTERVATDITFEDIISQCVDFQQYEGVYRVPTTGPVEPFLVCWFGLPGRDVADSTAGALVGVDPMRPLADGEYLRGWFTGVSGLALVLVDAAVLAASEVPALLESHLRSWASDREVHVASEGPS